MADDSSSTPNIPTQLTDPLDQVLAALLETMAVLAEDPALHSRILAVLAADWLRQHGGEDPYMSWRAFEAEVTAHYGEALRLARHTAPLHPSTPLSGASRRRPTAAKASSRPTRFGDGRM
jgi:hypothetical protein